MIYNSEASEEEKQLLDKRGAPPTHRELERGLSFATDGNQNLSPFFFPPFPFPYSLLHALFKISMKTYYDKKEIAECPPLPPAPLRLKQMPSRRALSSPPAGGKRDSAPHRDTLLGTWLTSTEGSLLSQLLPPPPAQLMGRLKAGATGWPRLHQDFTEGREAWKCLWPFAGDSGWLTTLRNNII